MKDVWPSKIFGTKQNNGEIKDSEDKVTEIPIHLITRSSHQPREYINTEKVEELAQSIKTYGLLQPIIVRKTNSGYEIVAGERRYLALQKLNRRYVKAIVKYYSDSAMAALAMIENLQRENLNIIEEAKGYERLIKEFNLTQEVLAQRLGKSQSTIANKMRLLSLPKDVKYALGNEEITERHARTLLRIKNKQTQMQVLNKIRENSLNVKQTEELIDELINEGEGDEYKDNKMRKKKIKSGIIKDYRIFVNTIKKSIAEIKKAGVTPEVIEEEYEDKLEIKITLPK